MTCNQRSGTNLSYGSCHHRFPRVQGDRRPSPHRAQPDRWCAPHGHIGAGFRFPTLMTRCNADRLSVASSGFIHWRGGRLMARAPILFPDYPSLMFRACLYYDVLMTSYSWASAPRPTLTSPLASCSSAGQPDQRGVHPWLYTDGPPAWHASGRPPGGHEAPSSRPLWPAVLWTPRTPTGHPIHQPARLTQRSVFSAEWLADSWWFILFTPLQYRKPLVVFHICPT